MRISDWSSDVCSSDLRFVWVVALANFLVGALILLLYSVVARRRLERQMAHQKALVTEKLEAVGMMTSSVAHDFSNLLAATSAGVYLLRKRGPEEAPHSGIERNSTILNSSH